MSWHSLSHIRFIATTTAIKRKTLITKTNIMYKLPKHSQNKHICVQAGLNFEMSCLFAYTTYLKQKYGPSAVISYYMRHCYVSKGALRTNHNDMFKELSLCDLMLHVGRTCYVHKMNYWAFANAPPLVC